MADDLHERISSLESSVRELAYEQRRLADQMSATQLQISAVKWMAVGCLTPVVAVLGLIGLDLFKSAAIDQRLTAFQLEITRDLSAFRTEVMGPVAPRVPMPGRDARLDRIEKVLDEIRSNLDGGDRA